MGLFVWYNTIVNSLRQVETSGESDGYSIPPDCSIPPSLRGVLTPRLKWDKIKMETYIYYKVIACRKSKLKVKLCSKLLIRFAKMGIQ